MSTPLQPLATKPLPDANADTRELLVLLAREVAMELEDVDVIIQRKQITKSQYEKILNNPFYKKVLEAEREIWRSTLNAEQRLRIHAAFMLENALPDYYRRVKDPSENLNAVTEGIKTFAKIAGIGEKNTQQGSSEKFLISINIGGGKSIHREVETPVVKTIEHDPTPTGDPNGKSTVQ